MKEKNVKHITKTLAVVSLFAPMTAQPLGIGDIELHSALNQKLNAEIRLHLAPGENPADISVRLASPEKFDKAGVPWNYVLSKIKFKTVEQANGSVVIKVTSNETLTEPFLDFLMEVSWPQGSQFREFTVLLDPPAGYHPQVIPSSTITAEVIESIQKPVAKARPAKRRIVSTAAASHITPQTATDGEYGPTQNADNLWGIAKQLGSERGVPTNHMMAALFHANPEAFIQGNIDALKTGAVLKIPVTDAILGGSAARSKQKPTQKETTPPTQTADAAKALELEAPIEAKVTDTAQIGEQSKAGDETGTAGGSGEESRDAGKDLELKDRIDQLEQQLNMMQQLLALKDQQLAALQSKDIDAARQAAESAKNLQALQPSPPDITEQQPVPEQAVKPTPPVQQAPEPKPTPAPAPEKPKPASAPTPPPVPPEEDFFSSTGYYLTVGGLGVGIFGMLGWLWWRKRQIEEETNTDSMFASASQIKLPDSDSSLSVPVIDMSTSGSYDVGTVGESSFISDFTPSDFEAFDTDQNEVDPMSEADVYLAYGRYQQAEDLIRHAIGEQPDKDDYKLKLLEIFYANENKERFAKYAQELANAGKNADRPFWTKVSDMAKELIPESPLFGGAPSPEQPELKPADFEVDEEEDRFDFDALDKDSADFKASQQPESDDNSLDFDLSSFSDQAKPVQEVEPETSADIESIDFDLGKLDEETSAETDKKEQSPSDSLESFDFNFDLDTETSTEKESDDKGLDLESFDFSDLGSIGDDKKPAHQKPGSDQNQLDSASDFDFNFDFNAPSSPSTAASSDEDFDLGVADLTDMDEFETKIDLAKAYIDMGDAAAAKTIAEEVLKKGNTEQKQAAQAILDDIK